MSEHYARNLRRRCELRDEGLCIDCQKDKGASDRFWRCFACRRIHSQKQIARNRKKQAPQKAA